MTTSVVTSPTPGALFDPTKFLAEKTIKSLVRQMLTDAGHDMTKYSKGNAPHTHEAQCAACKSIVTINVANNEVRLTLITDRGITSADTQVLLRGGSVVSCQDVLKRLRPYETEAYAMLDSTQCFDLTHLGDGMFLLELREVHGLAMHTIQGVGREFVFQAMVSWLKKAKTSQAIEAPNSTVPDQASAEVEGEEEVAAQNRQAGFVPSSTAAKPRCALLRTPSLSLLASAALLTTGLAHAADFSEQTEQRPSSVKDVLLDTLREAGGWTYQLRPGQAGPEITLFDASDTAKFRFHGPDEDVCCIAALEFLTNRDAKPVLVLDTAPSSTEMRVTSELAETHVRGRFTNVSTLAPRRHSLRPVSGKPVRFELTPERKELADARIQEVLQRSLPARKNSLAGKIQSVFGTRNKLLKQAGKNDWRQQPLAPGGDKNCRACHGVAVPCRNHRGRHPVA